MSHWTDVSASFERGAPELVCRTCQEEGVPRAAYPALRPHHHLALRELAKGLDTPQAIRNAARASGLSTREISYMLEGRRVPEFRRAWQLFLESAGLDMASIVNIAVEASRAMEQKYHRGEERFVEFPDHKTRFRTAQWAAKHLELEPSQKSRGTGGVTINVVTNLGNGEELQPPGRLVAKPKGRPERELPETIEVSPE